ncbi:hypothetical protein O181_122418 [Austropuccinia psidii MF-1]|uniref:Uncharacterized protein n=1 Tax=Austropuccinia psidii MF-1 TaxID=1389203 RepID=A0A9Q3KJC3_9BASI|nr:hypothetical protein [Austropuccinia psidii MF-1]
MDYFPREFWFCHNHGNSPPWISIWHIKPQSIYGQLAISITSGQYAHIIILWTIYGHLSFGAFMALHLNPESIEAIYAQLGISGHFPQKPGEMAQMAVFGHLGSQCAFVHSADICAFCAFLCTLRTLTHSVQKTLSFPLGRFLAQNPKVAKNPKGPRNTFPSSEAITSIFFPAAFPSQDLWK